MSARSRRKDAGRHEGGRSGKTPPPEGGGAPARWSQRGRRLLLGGLAAAVAGAGYAGWQLGGARARSAARVAPAIPPGEVLDPVPPRNVRPQSFAGKRGPWGQLEYTRISIEPPEAFLPDPARFGEPEWFFEGLSRQGVEVALREAGLGVAELATLAERGEWDVSPEGVVVKPPVDLVLAMSPATRASVYTLLARWEPNVLQQYPAPVERAMLDEPLQIRGISPATAQLLKRLVYQRGTWTVFSDLQSLLMKTHVPEERVRLVALSLRNRTYMVALKIDENSDIAALERYWDYEGRGKKLGPLFRSLARVPGGHLMDVAHLLPPAARRRVYTYPSPAEAEEHPRDCYWTSLNFFRDPPDDSFTSPERALAHLHAQYHSVDEPYQFGDVVALYRARDDRPIHTAIFLADDLVFTKNGRSPRQPWMFMKLDNMLSYYASVVAGDRVAYRVFRPRSVR